MKVLVTGGTGYVGSHTLVQLLSAGHDCVVVDNLCNSGEMSLSRVASITGLAPVFVRGDVRDAELLKNIFKTHKIDAVFHFAGLKSVEESVFQPLRYIDNNVNGSFVLLQAMAVAGVFQIVFSSSATVYGVPTQVPISELCPVAPINPYGCTKLTVERRLQDLSASDSRWRIAILRYFNPAGAHQSGLLGEDPNGVPNNLLPLVARVAVGKHPELLVFGNDYPTQDGTGVRDYIHVLDLADGHLRALERLQGLSGAYTWNLGTGRGYSVLDIVRAFELVSGRVVPYRIAQRRPGDIAVCYADPSKARRELGWMASRGLEDIVRDTWRWQSMNPYGYLSN